MRIVRFEKAQRFRVFNRTLQGFLFTSACLMAFFLSWKYLPSIDITGDGRFSLTPETTAYLRTLDKEVEIVGSLSLGEEGALGSARLHEVKSLTARYALASKKLKVKWIDGFRAQAEYGFKNPYRMLVRCGERTTWITPEELYLPNEDVFLGERALTSALWRLLSPTERQVIVVTPKERWEAEGAWGLRRLSEFFTARNTAVRQMEPGDLAGEIPQADAVFILGASDKWSTEALANLQRMVNDHKNNLFVALDETPNDPMERFLYFNGLNWSPVRVEERDMKEKTPSGEVLSRNFGEHTITESLRRNQLSILSHGRWWGLEMRPSMLDVNSVALLKSSPKSTVAGSEQKGPFNLMLAVERKTAEGNSTRMIVSGSSDWLSNSYLSYRGNQAMLEAASEWVMGSNNLLSIPSRTRQIRQLGLNSVQLWRLGGWIFSCSLVLFGLAVIRWATRPR